MCNINKHFNDALRQQWMTLERLQLTVQFGQFEQNEKSDRQFNLGYFPTIYHKRAYKGNS